MMRPLGRRVALAFLDVAVVALSLWFALYIRFDGDIPTQHLSSITTAIIVFVALRIPLFYAMGLYHNLWRYAGIRQLYTIILAVALGSVVLYALDALTRYVAFPRSIYLIEFMITLLGVGGIRLLVRLRRVLFSRNTYPKSRRALIIGAGDAGLLLLREFQNQPWLGVNVVGFVDDDPSKIGRRIDTVPVLGPRADIADIVGRHAIDQVIIAMPSAGAATLHETINLCKKTRAQLQILPAISDVIRGDVSARHVRDVDIQDLLRRDVIKTDLEAIAGYLEGRRVLVTGAGGSIGSELCRQVAGYKPEMIFLLGHGENSIFDIQNELSELHPSLPVVPFIADVQDEEAIDRIFDEARPHVVFHAAAHKHVPLMEANPVAAVRNNVFGTRTVARAAARLGCDAFVMISTDKAVNPGNIMGATKRMAEMVVQSMTGEGPTRFVSVRFGNVLGSRGSVVPLFKKQIARGGPVTVTHPEMRRYFMTIPEAVQLVLQAGSLGRGGEVFLLDMGEPVRIVDLATDLIRLSGFEPGKDIEIVFTGIRPGEKLFEELVNHGEHVSRTQHEKINMLNGSLPSPISVELTLQEMSRHIKAGDVDALIACLYEAVGSQPVQVAPTAVTYREVAAADE